MALSTSTFRPSPGSRIPILSRRPVRISITVSHSVHEALLKRTDIEGRSLSNLAAYLLEAALLQGDVAGEGPDRCAA